MDISIHQISEGAHHATLNYFTLSPESPDGTRVIYCRFDAVPYLRTGGRSIYQRGQLWLCDRDGNHHRPITAPHVASAHNGMSQTWLDDDTIAFFAYEEEQLHLVTLSTGEERAFRGGHVSHYSPSADEILFSSQGTPGLPIKGAYAVNRRGNVRALATMGQLERFAPFGARGQNPYSPDTWVINHPYWSPDSQTISIVVRIRPGEAYTMLVDPDGENLHPWSRTEPRPMHPYWFDSESVYGHDHSNGGDRFARRYDMLGNRIETLSGPGCHGAISPDRQWIATEDWYWTDPTKLYLYRRGQTEPTAVLATQESHWQHSDMHATFSPDGRRVYFNYHVPGSEQARLFFADLSSLEG